MLRPVPFASSPARASPRLADIGPDALLAWPDSPGHVLDSFSAALCPARERAGSLLTPDRRPLYEQRDGARETLPEIYGRLGHQMEPISALHRLGSRCLCRSSIVADPGPGSRPGFLGGMRIQVAAVSAFLRGEDIEDLMTLQIFLQVCVKRYFFFLSLASEGE